MEMSTLSSQYWLNVTASSLLLYVLQHTPHNAGLPSYFILYLNFLYLKHVHSLWSDAGRSPVIYAKRDSVTMNFFPFLIKAFSFILGMFTDFLTSDETVWIYNVCHTIACFLNFSQNICFTSFIPMYFPKYIAITCTTHCHTHRNVTWQKNYL